MNLYLLGYRDVQRHQKVTVELMSAVLECARPAQRDMLRHLGISVFEFDDAHEPKDFTHKSECGCERDRNFQRFGMANVQ